MADNTVLIASGAAIVAALISSLPHWYGEWSKVKKNRSTKTPKKQVDVSIIQRSQSGKETASFMALLKGNWRIHVLQYLLSFPCTFILVTQAQDQSPVTRGTVVLTSCIGTRRHNVSVGHRTGQQE